MTTQMNDRRNAHRDTSSTGNIWTPDAEVKVGYMRLRVVKRIPTPGDGRPDQWALTSLDGTRDYVFAPYSGLKKTADRRQADRTKPRLVAKTASVPAKVRTPVVSVELARPMTQAERLDRLEAMLLRVAERLEPAPVARRKAG